MSFSINVKNIYQRRRLKIRWLANFHKTSRSGSQPLPAEFRREPSQGWGTCRSSPDAICTDKARRSQAGLSLEQSPLLWCARKDFQGSVADFSLKRSFAPQQNWCSVLPVSQVRSMWIVSWRTAQKRFWPAIGFTVFLKCCWQLHFKSHRFSSSDYVGASWNLKLKQILTLHSWSGNLSSKCWCLSLHSLLSSQRQVTQVPLPSVVQSPRH